MRATKQYLIAIVFAFTFAALFGCSSSEARKKKTSAKISTQVEIPASLTDRPEQILQRTAYTVSYNQQTRSANWVAWRLTSDHAYGNVERKGMGFTEDTDVPEPRATNDDYRGSGYSRGHLCPAGDNKWSESAMQETFLLTNVCLQNRNLNSGVWNDIEMKCRKWARKYGEVYIVCGPIFYSNHPQTKGKHQVAVPDAFFKVVLCLKDTPKAIGFVCANSNARSREDTYVKTVDEVERITGIDFFPALSDEVEKQIEAEANYRAW